MRHILLIGSFLLILSILNGQQILCVESISPSRPCTAGCTCAAGVSGGLSTATYTHNEMFTVPAGEYVELTFTDQGCPGNGEQMENADQLTVTVNSVSGTYECTCANGCCPISCTTSCGTNGASGPYLVPSISTCYANEGTVDVDVNIDIEITANRRDECVLFDVTSTPISGSPPPSCTILANSIKAFNANLIEEERSINLSWLAERGNEDIIYEVLRKGEIGEFYAIGIVKSSDLNPEDEAAFVFKDEDPLNQINYYRIKLVNTYSLMEEYSYVKSIIAPVKDQFLIVNPIYDQLEILNFKHTTQVKLINALGQEVLDFGMVAPNEVAKFDVTQLLGGYYFLTLRSENGELVTRKIMKR